MGGDIWYCNTQMRSLVFQPEGGEIEPESRCRVNWDIKLEQVAAPIYFIETSVQSQVYPLLI